MLTKEAFLAQLQTDRHALLQTLDDLPEAALTEPVAPGDRSALDILAHLTARDGEMLRRIAWASRESYRVPHDVHDEAYWVAWLEEQVQTKRIMGPRGIKVDMAGTWVRLLATLEALAPADFERWLELDPLGRDRPEIAFTGQLRAWRAAWERSRPWWQRLARTIKRRLK